MAGPLATILRQLHRLTGAAATVGLTDRHLLERFATGRNEAAFAALVQRHGALVWGVCLRILGAEHDAEDAFQATFLVLVRKAASLGKVASVAAWLHGVAYRVALKARAEAAQRRARERQAEAVEPRDPRARLVWRHLRPVLAGALARLPEKYRAAVVLCHREGRTYAEAARQLGWADGTVCGRLARARALLRARLVRRGLTLSAGTLATAL